MTKVTVKYKQGQIVSISAEGHSGYAPHGEDIVCAAVSVLMQTAVNSMYKVAGFDYIIYDEEPKTAYMYLELPGNVSDDQALKAQIILKTVLTGFQGISESYPKYIRLYEKGGANTQ
ncbi:MAG: ribosomal-processing cysteine protease Prp [Clostridia bacterium]|nr:ribosomal-processing cysteine protease Prp [Clostridia bacterium]